MNPTAVSLLYLFATLGAVGFAAFAPREHRLGTVMLALCVLGHWIVTEWTYHEASPQLLFKQVGFPIKFHEIWAFTDGLVGLAAIALAGRWWLGSMVLGVVIVQEYLHVAYSRGLPLEGAYLSALDASYAAMLLAFYIAGGPGVSAFVRNRSNPRLHGNRARGMAKDAVT